MPNRKTLWISHPVQWDRWSERRDSNPRPLVPQTSALTGLRYAPTLAHDPYRVQLPGSSLEWSSVRSELLLKHVREQGSRLLKIPERRSQELSIQVSYGRKCLAPLRLTEA